MSAATEPLQKGRYRIDSPAFGSGSNAIYPAYDTTSDAKVYVKEIVVTLGKVTTLSQQENSRLAFENAARRMSEFRHDSILQVKDFYSEVGRQYLVLENVEGSDLQSLLADHSNRHSLETALDLADQLLDAVNFLHNQRPQILHRAICPKNVLISADGKVKLLGVTVQDESGNDLSTAIAETNDGSLNFSPLELIWSGLDAASQKVILGSYDDRSEKVLKGPADVRSDIYSIGATVYFLLTGRTPTDPLERSIELLEGNRDPLASPNSLDSHIAPEISDVVMRALEIKREARFDSAMIMRQVLRTSVVRAKEREAAEAQEMNEAAELMRNTQQLQMPVAAAELSETKASEPAPALAVPTDAEILAQKLREAEEMRLEAERKMAEAERMLREQEVQRARLEAQAKAIHSSAETRPAISADEDLLGISIEPVKTAENAVQHDISEADEDIHLSVKPTPRAKIDLREIAKKSEPAQQQAAIESPRPAEPKEEPDAFLLEVEEPVATPAAHFEAEVSAAPALSYAYADEPKRSGLPMAMIAGVAAVIVLAAVGGFMFLGGSSSNSTSTTEAPSQTQQPQAAAPIQQIEQPAPAPVAEQQPVAQPEQVNSFAQTDESATTDAPAAVETHTAAKPAPAPKKVSPPKTPAAKKPVTVEDLINDN